jgi:hypothetical protein
MVYKKIQRDKTNHNSRIGSSLTIPKLHEVVPNPTTSGQLYYNINTDKIYYANASNQWIIVGSGSDSGTNTCGIGLNLPCFTDSNPNGCVLSDSDTNKIVYSNFNANFFGAISNGINDFSGISSSDTAVYVTGSYNGNANVYNSDGSIFGNLSSENDGAFVVKYSSANGIAEWATKIDGSSIDRGYGISATDSSVYVTGFYNENANVYSSNGAVLNLQPAIDNAVFVVKYNTNGIVEWATRIDGINEEYGYGISVNDSAVYVTGTYTGDATVYNSVGSVFRNLFGNDVKSLFVVKYNTNGNAEWATRIDGSADDVGYGISATDSAVYVTGFYDGTTNVYNSDGSIFGNLSSTNNGAFVVKYSASNGVAEWASKIDGSFNDYGYGISATDSAVYVTGSYDRTANVYNSDGSIFGNLSATNIGTFVVKYSTANGIAEWAVIIDGTNNDIGYGISAADSAVYVTGLTVTNNVKVWDSISNTSKQLYPSSVKSGNLTFILKIDEKCKVSIGLNADTTSFAKTTNLDGKVPIVINGKTYYVPLIKAP